MSFDTILAIDWGKEFTKRRVWIADVKRRTVRPLAGSWSLPTVLAAARKLRGRTLIGIDAALGLPQAYFDAARASVPAWTSATDFLSWLRCAVETPRFFDEVRVAADWSHARPFLAVPAGAGALTAFRTRAGGKLLRAVDAATRAKSLFIVSGIRGTVGSGTRLLWRDLAPLLGNGQRDFAVWPFEGSLASLDKKLCLAEIYPRACYAIALDPLPAAPRDVSKVILESRIVATDALLATSWFRSSKILLDEENVALAKSNEDDFDAMISAAALLRCVLEKRSLERPLESVVEGGMLGMGLLDFTRPTARARAPRAARRAKSGSYACPIDGCTKVFSNSRGGWDSHVGSLRNHPAWHPSERDHKRRQAKFREEHREWFA